MGIYDKVDLSSITAGSTEFFILEEHLRERNNKKDYLEFLEFYINQLEQSEHKTPLLGTLYSKVAYTLLFDGKETDAKRYFERAIEIYEMRIPVEKNYSKRDEITKWLAYNSEELASILIKEGEEEKAVIFLEKSLNSFESLEGILEEDELNTQIAVVSYHFGRLHPQKEKKIELLEKSYKILTSAKLKMSERLRLEKIVDVCKYLGEAYDKIDDLKRIFYLEEAINTAKVYKEEFKESLMCEGFLMISLAHTLRYADPQSDKIEPNYKKGIELLEELRKTNPVNIDKVDKTIAISSYILAVRLFKEGKHEEEIKYLKKVVEYGYQEKFKDDINLLRRVYNAAYFLTKKGFNKYVPIHDEVGSLIRRLEHPEFYARE